MSAMGSVIVMVGSHPSSPWYPHTPRGFARTCDVCGYQLLLVMPGGSPRCAISRTQTRQSPNLRYTERGRPHRWHREYARTANFGVALALLTSAVFAMVSPP